MKALNERSGNGRRIKAFLSIISFMMIAAASAPVFSMHTNRFHDNFYDGYNNQLQIQREQLSSQEEIKREESRAIRRDELEGERKIKEKDFLETGASMRKASQAASQAPRAAYYRRPGHAISSLPTEHTKLKVGESTYFHDRGVFYRKLGERYVSVYAPLGAVVGSLPKGVQEAFGESGQDTYYYYFGTFYQGREGQYTVVKPPVGILVGYVPDGYTEVDLGGVIHYRFGETHYQPYYFQGVLVYLVVQT